MDERRGSHDDRHEAKRYEIRLKGRLDGSWAEWLGGMSLTYASDGTTEDTITASTSRIPSSRSASRPESWEPSMSTVASRSVARRQLSTSSSPRNMPICVWVLPTSIARSTAADYRPTGAPIA